VLEIPAMGMREGSATGGGCGNPFAVVPVGLGVTEWSELTDAESFDRARAGSGSIVSLRHEKQTRKCQ
jgi:hypothetical protein